TLPGVMVLGFDEYEDVPVTEIALAPGDVLLAYTDGLTERFSMDDELYGEERLLNVLQANGAGSPHSLREAVVKDLKQFAAGRPSDDDQAFIVLKII
ncbi:MAG: serine/threonine-protein phosphatase, partial [Desulfosarcina sp.]|nr:serine/threonine-protein phosphatase [Desulfobacterales bacterium]